MSIRQRLRMAARGAAKKAVQVAYGNSRENRNVDMTLASALQGAADPVQANDAIAYVELIRTCIEPLAHDIITIKKADRPTDAMDRRFAILLEVLGSRTLPLPLPVAIDIAKVADRYRGLTVPFDQERWSGDVGLHFEISSSFGRKGRVLASIIRVCRPQRCLDLGTAYGMSAIFMMEAYKSMEMPGSLVTVEGSELQFSLASRELESRYGAGVTCRFGRTSEVLPQLAEETGPINFMFHDAGHTGDDYINDFQAIVDALAPGAVILFDDIRWEDIRFHPGPAHAHEGWLKVAAHSRVRWAVEVEKKMGLALLE